MARFGQDVTFSLEVVSAGKRQPVPTCLATITGHNASKI